jgi:hypothetical protein
MLRDDFGAGQVLLFGSVARGRAGPGSEVDLLLDGLAMADLIRAINSCACSPPSCGPSVSASRRPSPRSTASAPSSMHRHPRASPSHHKAHEIAPIISSRAGAMLWRDRGFRTRSETV